MNAKGQLWSLDVVLAGLLFTVAIGLILSQTELHLFSSQQERNVRELPSMALLASNHLTSAAELLATVGGATENIRCGPNFATPATLTSVKGWSYELDLSWLDNCFIDRGTLTPSSLGLPSGFSASLSGTAPWGPLSVNTGATLPSNVAFSQVTRKMMVFQNHVGVTDFRKCEDGACLGKPVDVTVTVWRS